ncbi:hypothetical protein PVT67_11215 [Gallaecimonas kandeliae]|uniref:hypothetical protein n=1 Tax=Gallaecimonas kandeliae TaxID=3029055 RepID=UPI00264A3652|nr:hypothetical protein [Gallaecimonas kandeliae]WKE64260.1 hypothetical protein PVT67_11215 [Gallaecimonas kandeliae]
MRYLALLFLALAATACQQQESPDDFYRGYNQKVIAGMASLEEDAAYYSARKRQEMAAHLEAFMAQSHKTKAQAIAFYLDFSHAVAKCKKITLVSQQQDGDVANLTYNQQDVCGNPTAVPETQKVRLVREDGWKIDDISLSL